MKRPQSSGAPMGQRSRPSSSASHRSSTPTAHLNSSNTAPDHNTSAGSGGVGAAVKVSETIATVTSAFINSPASPSDISGRLERITRLHRRWQGWTSLRPSSTSSSTPVSNVDDIRMKPHSSSGHTDDAAAAAAAGGGALPSYLERLKEVARGVAEEGGAVWAITEQLTDVLHRFTKPQPHQQPGAPMVSNAEAAAVVTSCLEALTVVFAPDAVLGATFRQLFEIVKRVCFVDHAQLLAESDIAPDVRSFVRYTTDPSTRADRQNEVETEAELRGYVGAATSVDWGTWVKHRSADLWAHASPHALLRANVSDNAIALGRDVAALDQKLALHRAGKPILRRGGAQGFAFAVATGERTAADAHAHDVEQHVGNTTPVAKSPTNNNGDTGEGSVTAARDSLTLRLMRQAVAFRGWREGIRRQKALGLVTHRWSRHVAGQALGNAFRAWRLETTIGKCNRRGDDLRASEASFSAERLLRMDTLVQLKAAERQTESLWVTVENLRSENRSYASRLGDMASPMVFDFRRPMYDALTGHEWVEGTLRFRKHTPAADASDQEASTHGYADLFFDLEHRAPPPAKDGTGDQHLAPRTAPKSHYVVRLEDTKPAGVAKPAVEPTLAVLNDILAAMARTAHRDNKRRGTSTASASPTHSPKARSGNRGSPTYRKRHNADTPPPDPPKKLTLLEALAVDYGSHQEARIAKFDACWSALCEVRAVAAATARSSALGKPLTLDEIRRALREELASAVKSSANTTASVHTGVTTNSMSDANGDGSQSNVPKTAVPPVIDYAQSKAAADATVPPKRFVVDAFAFEPQPSYYLKDMNTVTDRPELLAAVAASLTTPALLSRHPLGSSGVAAVASSSTNTGNMRLPPAGYNSSSESGTDDEEKESELTFEASTSQSPPMPYDSASRTNPLQASPTNLQTKKSVVIANKTPYTTRVALRALRRLGLLGRVEDAVFNPMDPTIPTHVRRAALQLVCARLHSYSIMKPNFEEAIQSRSTSHAPPKPPSSGTLARTDGATGSGVFTHSSNTPHSLSFSAMLPAVSFQNVASHLQPSPALTSGLPTGLPAKMHPLLVELADQRVGRLRSDARILAPVLEWTRHTLADARGGAYVDVESWLWGESHAVPPRNFGEDFGDGLSLLVAVVASLAPAPFSDAHAAWIASTEGVEHDVVEWLLKAAADLGAHIVNIPPVRAALLAGDADGKALYLTGLYLTMQARDVLPPALSPSNAWALPAPGMSSSVAVSSALHHDMNANLNASSMSPSSANLGAGNGANAINNKPIPLSILNGVVPVKPPTSLVAKLSPFIPLAKKGQSAKSKPDGLEPVFKVVATAWIGFLRSQCLRFALLDADVIPADLSSSAPAAARSRSLLPEAAVGALPTLATWDASDDGETVLGLSYDAAVQWLAPAVKAVIKACSSQQQIINASALSASTMLSASSTAQNSHAANAATEVFSSFGLAPLLQSSAVDLATDAAIDLQLLRAWLQCTRMTPDDSRHDASNHSVSTSAGRVVAWWKTVPKEHQSNAGRFATARKGPLTAMMSLHVSSGIEFVMRSAACVHAFLAHHWPTGNAAGGIKPPTVVACAEALCYALRHLHPSPSARLADNNFLRWSTLLPDDCLSTLRACREPLANIFVAHSVSEVKTWATLEARAMSRGNAIKCFTRWWALCWASEAMALAAVGGGGANRPTSAPSRAGAPSSGHGPARVSVGLCTAVPPSNAHVLVGRCFDIVFTARCDKGLRDGGVPMLPFGKAKPKASRGRNDASPDLISAEEAFEAVVSGKHACAIPPAVARDGSEEATRPGVVATGTTLAEYEEDHDCVTFSGFCEVLAGVARLAYPVPWLRTSDAVALMVDVAKRAEFASAA